jgi:hypothetical protein
MKTGTLEVLRVDSKDSSDEWRTNWETLDRRG